MYSTLNSPNSKHQSFDLPGSMDWLMFLRQLTSCFNCPDLLQILFSMHAFSLPLPLSAISPCQRSSLCSHWAMRSWCEPACSCRWLSCCTTWPWVSDTSSCNFKQVLEDGFRWGDWIWGCRKRRGSSLGYRGRRLRGRIWWGGMIRGEGVLKLFSTDELVISRLTLDSR